MLGQAEKTTSIQQSSLILVEDSVTSFHARHGGIKFSRACLTAFFPSFQAKYLQSSVGVKTSLRVIRVITFRL